MLSDVQKNDIIKLALDAFYKQYGVMRNVSDMDLKLDKPNNNAICSIFISSFSDKFRIKLNLTAIENTTAITAYRDNQFQDYGPGIEDEVVVAELKLTKANYPAFYIYLNSSAFQDAVINNRNLITDADTVNVTSEEGYAMVFEDKGV